MSGPKPIRGGMANLAVGIMSLFTQWILSRRLPIIMLASPWHTGAYDLHVQKALFAFDLNMETEIDYQFIDFSM